jgi:hypothetical protein
LDDHASTFAALVFICPPTLSHMCYFTFIFNRELEPVWWSNQRFMVPVQLMLCNRGPR